MLKETKKRLKELERQGRTIGVDFLLFEVKGFRRETLIRFHGPIEKFWAFVKETLGGYK